MRIEGRGATGMPTVQEMVEIAARYATAMARAMIAACTRWADSTGQTIVVPESAASMVAGRPDAFDVFEIEYDEYVRMVERNGDTRWQHV